MKGLFAMLAGYNRWANRRLYAAARALPDAEYRKPRGAFFGSLHGTLNHLVVADRIWMRRFTGEGPVQTRLDEILFDEFEALDSAREVEDQRIISFVDGLGEADLAATFTYRTIVNPQDITQPLMPALAHFFNHQTHHRGQAHGLITAIAGNAAAPSLDLILYQRETGVGLS
ncbi:MAG TPA: DinB family protein [Bauldia sp.]|nr:DinB family protein [Bauldia sp.]